LKSKIACRGENLFPPPARREKIQFVGRKNWIGVPMLLATALYPFPGLIYNAAMLVGEALDSAED
jgi:hypothetical protein